MPHTKPPALDPYVEYDEEALYHIALGSQTACGRPVSWSERYPEPPPARTVCVPCQADPRTLAVEVRQAAALLTQRFAPFRAADHALLHAAQGYLLAYAARLETKE